jgi:hypothetical protein
MEVHRRCRIGNCPVHFQSVVGIMGSHHDDITSDSRWKNRMKINKIKEYRKLEQPTEQDLVRIVVALQSNGWVRSGELQYKIVEGKVVTFLQTMVKFEEMEWIA